MIINDRYKLDTVLGKGGFGVVYRGHDNVQMREVAIKCVSLSHRGLSILVNKQKIEQEISLMMKLIHPNIVSYYDNVITDTHWYIIMEYCNYGTLADILSSLPPIKERESLARYYLVQLKDALKYLRQHDFVHRDLKPMNILLTKTKVVSCASDDLFNLDEDYQQEEQIILKLADFGLTKHNDNNTLMQTVCGSPMFMAPEILLEEDYDTKADLWSFGVIMYQMLIGKYPREAKTMAQLKTNALQPIDFHPEYGFSDACYDLLCRLLTDRSKRIEWDQLFEHEWFVETTPTIDFTSQIGQSKTVNKLGSSNLSKMKGIERLQEMSWMDTFELL